VSIGAGIATRIEITRLIGRSLGEDDLADLRLLHSDPRVTATLTADGRPLSEKATRDFLARSAEHWRMHQFGLFGFRDRASDEFVGYCGIKHALVEGADVVELAYAVRAAHHGKGYATEMARASVRFAFHQLRLEELVAFTLPHNQGSRRVMESCGFHYVRDITHAELPHVLYRLSR
jgi:[ribosomal protein S5]-alanine N-acetyltransferase